MRTLTVEFDNLSVTVSEATTLQGMRRTLLQLEANEANKKDDTDRALSILRSFVYPDLASVAALHEGFEMTFDAFILLPEKFTAQWEKAVYELNPHWQLGSETEEKKQPTTSLED